MCEHEATEAREQTWGSPRGKRFPAMIRARKRLAKAQTAGWGTRLQSQHKTNGAVVCNARCHEAWTPYSLENCHEASGEGPEFKGKWTGENNLQTSPSLGGTKFSHLRHCCSLVGLEKLRDLWSADWCHPRNGVWPD